jgi:hypothetical protein
MLFAQSRSFFPEHDHFPSPVKLIHGRVTGIPREIKQLPNGRRLANAGCGGRHENSTHVGHTCRRAGSGIPSRTARTRSNSRSPMGGVVHLRLTSGDYTIRAGTSDHIVMRWHADDPADANDMNKIKVRFSVSGKPLKSRSFHFPIYCNNSPHRPFSPDFRAEVRRLPGGRIYRGWGLPTCLMPESGIGDR